MANVVRSEAVAEQLRRVAARTTREIVLRRGRDLGIWVGCGFPKSGTVWLCQLMSAYLDRPYPRDYQLPIMMASVIHAHWRYDSRMPPTVYVVRDGRDVMVSLYFHQMRMLEIPRSPRRSRQLQETFTHLFGPKFDPGAVSENLPKFIDHEMTTPEAFRDATWQEHVRDWLQRPSVTMVTYESLLADTATELQRVMVESQAPDPDPVKAGLAAHRFEFERAAGRAAGQEDRFSFLRKGVSGDWRTYFTREAAEAFDAHAGDMLGQLGYEESKDWYTTL